MHTDMKNLNQKLMDLQSAVLSNSSAIKTQVEKVVEEIAGQTADLSVSSESSDDQDSKPSDDQ